MPTILTHAVVPVALGLGLGRQRIPRGLVLAGAIASMLPDLDALGFRFGIPYADIAGHRGLSHSLAVASLMAGVASLQARRFGVRRLTVFLFVFVAAASHGLLDMFTNGGHGVALLWPFTADRYFWPLREIEASPLSLTRLFGPQGLAVMQSEWRWVWMPGLLVFLGLRWLTAGRPTAAGATAKP